MTTREAIQATRNRRSARSHAAHLIADRQLVQLAADSPMRPVEGLTADVDGLALFDVARSPCFL